MSRAGGGPRTRVKTAKGRKVGSTRWLERQLNDPYVRQAKADGDTKRVAYGQVDVEGRQAMIVGELGPGGRESTLANALTGAAR